MTDEKAAQMPKRHGVVCEEYAVLLARADAANRQMFAWLAFCAVMALVWMGVALWALV